MITQQQAEDLLYEFAAAVDYFDDEFIAMKLGKIRNSIERRHPQSNVLAWLYEYGLGCLGQLQFFRANPQIPMPTPAKPEAFVPFKSTQVEGVKDIVKKQRKNAARKQQMVMA